MVAREKIFTRLIVAILGLSLYPLAFALTSTPPPIHIDRIVVNGNEQTKTEVILREITVSAGEWIDSAAIEETQLRVTNLNLFQRVEVFPLRKQDSTYLVISVTEKLYIYPLPFANWIGPNSNDFVYGFRYVQLNLGGMNRTVDASAWGGIDEGFTGLYTDPWISGTPGIGALAILQYNAWWDSSTTKSRGFHRNLYSGLLGVSKRFTPEITLYLYGGGQQSRVETFNSESGTETDNMIRGRTELIQERRDLIELPHRGDYYHYWLDWMRFTAPWKNRWVLGFDRRVYYPLSSRWTLSLQGAAITSTGENPPYLQMKLGESIPMRGYTKLADPGTFLAKGAFDLRYRLYPTRYWTWTTAPQWLEKYVRDLKYGLSVSAFDELGQAWNENETLKSKTLLTGYGIAFSFTLPYINILRLDCGFNPSDKARPNFRLEALAGL